MLRQLCVGASVTTCNIIIHALVTVIVIRVARAAVQRKTPHPWLGLASVMVAAALVLIVAHTLEVFVWSRAYMAAMESGCIAYLTKPFSAVSLIEPIEKALAGTI